MHRSSPAPLGLCFTPNFDQKDNETMCPKERNSLKSFYDASKGQDWTVSANWTDPYISHCYWYGVMCSNTNHTIKLELQRNGLSGTLSKHIDGLSLLEVLDLSNNDIKVGSI